MSDQVISLRERQWVSNWRDQKDLVMKEIFTAYYQPLWLTSYRMLSDRSLAEDMVQEVMARVWQMDSLDHIQSNFGGYLHRAVLNTTLNKIRERKRWATEPEDQLELTIRDVKRQAPEELKQAIELAIAALPDRCRLVFVFSRYEGMSNQQIADLMEISVKTVENQMTKAFRLLRSALGHLNAE
ncbi:MAG: sigma-70 family RNA polymerase sigma factor [Saprospiraceae bacterium]|nr:sigma-70 family RNA polymerase sigma factor [Saprospiraceae bacterium]MCB9311352.1 sigma-70 family RNA polymerase sigma factor [Lewinellaceae bacterium]HRW75148.1 sigma-70 family RNA polymerase sigma factor [Saprospiraceae bacterium]